MHAGLALCVAVVPLTAWPLPPTAYIPATAVREDKGPASPFQPLHLPPSAAHVMLSARDLFSPANSAADLAGIDRSCFGVSLSLSVPPGSLVPAVGGRAAGNRGTLTAQFLPFRCFPLTQTASRSEAVAVLRSDGTRAQVTLCAVARVGAAVCPEIGVHACVRVRNMLDSTLLVRPCRADPRVSAGGHSTQQGRQPCVAIPPGATTHLPADCVASRGVQLRFVHVTDPGSERQTESWSPRIPLMQTKNSTSPDAQQAARATPVTCGASVMSVRQHVLRAETAACAAQPLVTDLLVRPGVSVINTTPVAISVAVTDAEPSPVTVPPFAARGVMLPTIPLFVQLEANLAHSAASGAATVSPSRPALMHCRHTSSQATSTIVASLTRMKDAACIVLSAHACVLNLSPVPLHAVAARAQHSADTGSGDTSAVTAPLPLPRRLPGSVTVRVATPDPSPGRPRSASSAAVATLKASQRTATVPAQPNSARGLPSIDDIATVPGGEGGATAPSQPSSRPGSARRSTTDTHLGDLEAATASGSALPSLAQLEHLWPHIAPTKPHVAAPAKASDTLPRLAGLGDLLHRPRRVPLRHPPRSASVPAPPPEIGLRPRPPQRPDTAAPSPATAADQTLPEAAAQLEPLLLALPPEAGGAVDGAAPALLHLARLGDAAAVARASATHGHVLRLQGLRKYTLPLTSHSAADPVARTHTLHVPLQPGAGHTAKLHVSMHEPGAFGDSAADTIAGLDETHPALPALGAVGAPALVYVTPMHVVANRMHVHVALEQPSAGGKGIAPQSHQLLAPGATSLLLALPPRDADSDSPPTVRVTASDSGWKRCATVPLSPSIPVPIQLTAITVPPSAATVYTAPMPLRAAAPPHPCHAPAAPIPPVTCTALDPFADECATVHIVNLTAHGLRAYQPSRSPAQRTAHKASAAAPGKPETMQNTTQEVPPHSRRPFLWDSALTAKIAKCMGDMRTDLPTLPSIMLRLEVGVSMDVHVQHAHGWPVAVADWLSLPSRRVQVHKLGAAKVFADGAMAQDARAVAEGLHVDVRRVDVWRLEIRVSEDDPHTCSHTPAAHPARGPRPQSCLRAELSFAGALLTVVHAERSREVLVATFNGVHACLELDDEGRMHVRGSVASMRATNSYRRALFRVMLASPVVTARTTQVCIRAPPLATASSWTSCQTCRCLPLSSPCLPAHPHVPCNARLMHRRRCGRAS